MEKTALLGGTDSQSVEEVKLLDNNNLHNLRGGGW
jgi:hypothetical protein